MKKISLKTIVNEKKNVVTVIASKFIAPDFKFQGVGIAKCHPNDTFDECTGVRLAKHRAIIALCKQICNFYNNSSFLEIQRYVNQGVTMINEAREQIEKSQTVVKTIVNV